MVEVSCLRCGRSLPVRQMDIVGNGFRCEPCGLAALVAENNGEPDIIDNIDPATRADLARKSKLAGALTLAAFIIAPTIGWIVGGPLVAGMVAAGALYMGGGTLDITYTNWRRYRRARNLPAATARKLPKKSSAD